MPDAIDLMKLDKTKRYTVHLKVGDEIVDTIRDTGNYLKTFLRYDIPPGVEAELGKEMR